MKINLEPKICNLCGGKVEYTRLENVYGNKMQYFSNGKYCYHCKKCGAVVGTHKKYPKIALGILANREMADARQTCHKIFDEFWKTKEERTSLYQKLAAEMNIPFEECHFGWFTMEELEKSRKILLKWWREKYDK